MRTIEEIMKEYRPLAAQLGQLTYEYEQAKAQLEEKMVKLNQEALEQTEKTDAQ